MHKYNLNFYFTLPAWLEEYFLTLCCQSTKYLSAPLWDATISNIFYHVAQIFLNLSLSSTFSFIAQHFLISCPLSYTLSACIRVFFLCWYWCHFLSFVYLYIQWFLSLHLYATIRAQLYYISRKLALLFLLVFIHFLHSVVISHNHYNIMLHRQVSYNMPFIVKRKLFVSNKHNSLKFLSTSPYSECLCFQILTIILTCKWLVFLSWFFRDMESFFSHRCMRVVNRVVRASDETC